MDYMPLHHLHAEQDANDWGVIKRSMHNIYSVHCNLCPVPRRSYSSPGKETQILKNTWNLISKHKLPQSFDIVYRYRRSICRYRNPRTPTRAAEKSSISGYNDIEVLNFDIDASSISFCVDIKVLGFWVNRRIRAIPIEPVTESSEASSRASLKL